MKGGHWWPPYPWAKEKTGRKSQEWIDAFKEVEKSFKEINTSVKIVGDSAVENLPKITFEEFIEERKNA
jgi:hypothetical protein